MRLLGGVIALWRRISVPGRSRHLQKRGSGWFCFRWRHKKLLGGVGGGGVVLEALQFFTRLKAHGLARRDADFFAGARIAPDAGLARFHAENTEFPQLDALA